MEDEVHESSTLSMYHGTVNGSGHWVVTHGGRSVLVPSFVLNFPMLCSHAGYFIESFIRPISSFLHLLAMSGHASGSGAALAPAFAHKSSARTFTQINPFNAEVWTARELILDSTKEVTQKREHRGTPVIHLIAY